MPVPSIHAMPRYFYWVDGLRGIAAIAIVIFHYHHFYLADETARPTVGPASSYPWSWAVLYIYEYGNFAVELFWIISGFVFAHVYLAQKPNLRAFAMARLARLYPLHLATLLFVAALQSTSLALVGHWQIYGNNDLRHFVLNLAFASQWANQSFGLSFNGPIWSVSLEIVAYFLFFVLIVPLQLFGLWVAVACVGLFFWLGQGSYIDIPLLREEALICAGYFFIGVGLWMTFARLHRWSLTVLASAGALGLLGVVTPQLEIRIAAISAAAILVLAHLDQRFSTAGKALAPMGNISYSVYLVHVPLQMTILLLADLFFPADRSFADSPILLPTYVFASIGLAYAAHRWLERPLGRLIRSKLNEVVRKPSTHTSL